MLESAVWLPDVLLLKVEARFYWRMLSGLKVTTLSLYIERKVWLDDIAFKEVSFDS